jgi:hypothetical protein
MLIKIASTKTPNFELQRDILLHIGTEKKKKKPFILIIVLSFSAEVKARAA